MQSRQEALVEDIITKADRNSARWDWSGPASEIVATLKAEARKQWQVAAEEALPDVLDAEEILDAMFGKEK